MQKLRTNAKTVMKFQQNIRDYSAIILFAAIQFETSSLNTTTSPPQSHLGRARRYPHVRDCTVPLCVLAVACTMRNDVLRSVTGRYGSVTWRYGTLQSVAGHYGTWKRYGMLQSVTEHYGALWDVTERYGSVADRYGTLRERYGALTERYRALPENIDFAHH